jgi:hypothetical protein
MKKLFILLVFALSAAASANAQKVEVLYFKADLACCRARACDNLEKDVKSMIEDTYKEGDLKFTTVRISDEANKALVEKYKAGSQTVVIVTTRRRNESSMDISDIVRAYSRNRDKANFEKELLARISTTTK